MVNEDAGPRVSESYDAVYSLIREELTKENPLVDPQVTTDTATALFLALHDRGYLAPARRCIAMETLTERCTQDAPLGETVCDFHVSLGWFPID